MRVQPQPAALLRAGDLSVGIPVSRGEYRVIRDIELRVRRGESVGLVGESGSGKSTVALSLLGYLGGGLRVLAGRCFFGDESLFDLPAATLQGLRGGRLGLIPQNAGQALTPSLRITAQLEEAIELHADIPARRRQRRKIALLNQVRLPDPEVILKRYPHQLSGGQQQRVAIAMALAGEPEALILDEPTTGLDVTTQAHILELLDTLRKERNLAMIFVSHDLGVIARVCTRIVVLYAGEMVEEGPVREVLETPAHPYTRGLLASIPNLGKAAIPASMDGRPPSPRERVGGCLFAARCAHAREECRSERPAVTQLNPTRRARCRRLSEIEIGIGTKANFGDGRERPPGARGGRIASLQNVEIRYDRPTLLDKLRAAKSKPVATPATAATVKGVSLDIHAGETVALVGESGSGKSTLLKALSGLVPVSDGRIIGADGKDLPATVEARSREEKRRIQIVFQNPDASLNPRLAVEEILTLPLRLYENLNGAALRERIVELLNDVRLGPDYLRKFPGQLSGGEKQRIGIARAFAARPDLILCDEVTSALDVSVQAAVLNLLADLQSRTGTAILFVSHDLAVVRAIADRVVVLYQGRVCEAGPADRVFAEPSHPYTQLLTNAILEPKPGRIPVLLADDVTELSPPASGCPFQRRCTKNLGHLCNRETPPDLIAEAAHSIYCHLQRSAL